MGCEDDNDSGTVSGWSRPTNMTVEELAAAAVVATDTLLRFENGAQLKPRTVDAIREALENAGCEFVDQHDGGSGVRLRSPVGVAMSRKYFGVL